MSLEMSTMRGGIMRSSVSIVYDAQACRISTGNRIVQAVKRANGLIGTTTEDDQELSPEEREKKKKKEEKEERKFIQTLLDEYKMLAPYDPGDRFMSEATFQSALNNLGDNIKYMKDLFVYHMMKVYLNQAQTEETLVKVVAQMVKEHPIWDAFLKDITGCGPLMAAVCIAYLDPYKARHVSSFWRYAGLDVLQEEYDYKKEEEDTDKPKKRGRKPKNAEVAQPTFVFDPLDPVGSMETPVVPTPGTPGRPVLTKRVMVKWDDEEREVYEANVLDAHVTDNGIWISAPGRKFTLLFKEKDKEIDVRDENFKKVKGPDGKPLKKVIPGAKIVEWDIQELDVPEDAPLTRDVGRAKRHTIVVQYKASDGTIKEKNSITYNPTLKTKLVGVLGDSFLKCPGSRYEQIYRDYRHRLDCSSRHVGKTDAHKHMMAKRYMVKIFLEDLWVKWREIEGLPVSEPYAVAFLGRKPHGFNYDPEEING